VFAFLLQSECFAAKFNKKLDVGDQAPVWKDLQGVDGKMHSLDDLKKAEIVVVVFTCNHCPVAQYYEGRFIKFVEEIKENKKGKEKKVAFVAVSCSSDQADNFKAMKKRADEKKFNFSYLHDADQTLGRKYGATSTPQLFVLDKQRKIAYMGAFDDNLIESKIKHEYVRDAVKALLAGNKPEIGESRPKGCRIEYR